MMTSTYGQTIKWATNENMFSPNLVVKTKIKCKNGKEKNDIEKENKAKIEERMWGQEILKEFNKDTKLTDNTQWTTKIGEGIVKEVLEKSGRNVWKPKQKNTFKVDWETEDAMWEVKSRTWCTSGTIGEKILGCPFKYASIPIIYGKPLRIVCVAYQEWEAIHKFKLFGGASIEQSQQISLWKKMNIEFIKCTDLI